MPTHIKNTCFNGTDIKSVQLKGCTYTVFPAIKVIEGSGFRFFQHEHIRRLRDASALQAGFGVGPCDQNCWNNLRDLFHYRKETTRSEAISVKLCTASCLCLPSSWLWSLCWGQVDFSLQLFIAGKARACFRNIHSLCVLGVERSWGFSCILAHLFINPLQTKIDSAILS